MALLLRGRARPVAARFSAVPRRAAPAVVAGPLDAPPGLVRPVHRLLDAQVDEVVAAAVLERRAVRADARRRGAAARSHAAAAEARRRAALVGVLALVAADAASTTGARRRRAAARPRSLRATSRPSCGADSLATWSLSAVAVEQAGRAACELEDDVARILAVDRGVDAAQPRGDRARPRPSGSGTCRSSGSPSRRRGTAACAGSTAGGRGRRAAPGRRRAAAGTRPSAACRAWPASSRRFASRYHGCQRKFSCTTSGMPAASATLDDRHAPRRTSARAPSGRSSAIDASPPQRDQRAMRMRRRHDVHEIGPRRRRACRCASVNVARNACTLGVACAFARSRSHQRHELHVRDRAPARRDGTG